MGDVIPFRKIKPSVKHKGKSLCESGFHKWKADTKGVFDVKQGKLVTRLICERCGAVKVKST